jgi:deoxycytidylate deaminase
MKNESYLTLCLEQAAKSPLRYRHGCIIVRGGKVIGQGFNDYRFGFDGGALKTGRLAAGCPDDSAIAEFKKKHKLKRETKHQGKQKHAIPETSNKMFMPFENMGGGSHVNTPFSMHSEMMAIHSAFAASSTLASNAASTQKPCFKLSGGSRRKARLRKKAIKVYIETVCETPLAQSATERRSGSPSVQKRQCERPEPQTGPCGAFLQG